MTVKHFSCPSHHRAYRSEMKRCADDGDSTQRRCAFRRTFDGCQSSVGGDGLQLSHVEDQKMAAQLAQERLGIQSRRTYRLAIHRAEIRDIERFRRFELKEDTTRAAQ